MTATNPTPVVTYGRDAKIAESVREKLLPDIEGSLSFLPLSLPQRQRLTVYEQSSTPAWTSRLP